MLIFCGLIPFLGFAEALSTGVTSVTGNASLIKNTLFPIELVPVKTVFAGQCTQVAGTCMLLVAVTVVGRLTPWALLLPLIWVSQLLFTVGLIWILSSLNVYIRDLGNLVGVAILVLMIGSPIAWTPEMIPASLKPFMALNPLYYLIISYQDCLMQGMFPREGILWVFLVISLVTFFAGGWFFRRMKRMFADNV